jgi:hypothetical protein
MMGRIESIMELNEPRKISPEITAWLSITMFLLMRNLFKRSQNARLAVAQTSAAVDAKS